MSDHLANVVTPDGLTLPKSFIPARWSGVTGNGTVGVGLSLATNDGRIMVGLNPTEAKNVATEILQRLTIVHSRTSSGIPKVDVSTPPAQENA